jgi:glycine betaine/proline transport system substrate-binding protein
MFRGNRQRAGWGAARDCRAERTARLRAGGRVVAALLFAALTCVLLGSTASADPPEAAGADAQAIRFAVNDWTGQRITTHLMGTILAKAGHRVDYVEANYMDQLDEIAAGRIDVAMEYWSTAGMPALQEALAKGTVRIIGETGMTAREEWWYPAYVKERCPGLPDWRALSACATVFAVPETAPKGRYLGGPVTWGGFDEERVAALGLDFVVEHADTEADLYRALGEAVARRQPILLWIYAPHWAPTRYDGEWVQFPEHSEDCYAKRRYDCAKASGPIWKVGATGLEQRWPEAAQAIDAFHISNEDMGALIARVDVDGVSIEEAIDEWLARNETVWKPWLD